MGITHEPFQTTAAGPDLDPRWPGARIVALEIAGAPDGDLPEQRLHAGVHHRRRAPDVRQMRGLAERQRNLILDAHDGLEATRRRAGTIGSLLLGVHTPDGELSFAGGVGTGFTDAVLHDLQERLVPLRRETPPVADVPRSMARGAEWVEAEVVGEVEYRSWTPDGRLRHSSWRGLRPDRTPDEVRADRLP